MDGDPLIGKTLGAYEVREKLGTGGMATVYLGFQTSMERDVAIKVLPRQMALDPNFMGRFEQEAKTIAKLEHARILPVYDYGQQDGIAYIVMRYLPGGTLADRLLTDPPDLAEAERIIQQVSEGLDYAHGRGVIHRDVKPSNIMLDQSGDATLTDFGIAKLMEGTIEFTGSGIVGTPAYLAPEQGLGQPVDPRTDVYSLGVVLYEMVVGALPYQADTPMAMVIKHINEPLPAPRSVDPDIPKPVEAVIMRALAKDPTVRYQSCGALAQALSRAAAGEAIEAPAPSAPAVVTPPERPTAPAEQTVPLQASPAETRAPVVTPAPPAQKPRLPIAAIIGGAVGGALLIGLLVVAVLLARRGNLAAEAVPTETPLAATAEPEPTAEGEPIEGPPPEPAEGGAEDDPSLRARPLGSPICNPEQQLLDTRFAEPLPDDRVLFNLNAQVAEGALLLEPNAEGESGLALDVGPHNTIFTVTVNADEAERFTIGSRTFDNPDELGFLAVFDVQEGTVLLLRKGEVVVEPQPLPVSTATVDDVVQLRSVGRVVEVLLNGQRVLRFIDDLDLDDGGLVLAAQGGPVRISTMSVCAVEPALTSHNTLYEAGFSSPGSLITTDLIGEQRDAWRLEEGRLVAPIPPESDIVAGVRGSGITAPVLAFTPPAADAETLTVTVQVGVLPQENYQSAGVIVFGETGRPLFLYGRGYCEPSEPNCVGDGLYIQPAGEVVGSLLGERTGFDVSPPAEPILLRLVAAPNLIIALYSADNGATWQQVAELDGLLAERVGGVGLYTSAGGQPTEPILAVFDGFQIAEGTPEDATRP